MNRTFSIIIPVYNRPQEVEELLTSLTQQTFQRAFEIIIVEDGSTIKCDEVIEKYTSQLSIHYYCKENSGPGVSRNYGMKKASGNYFIILDSDVVLPSQYLQVVSDQLEKNYTDGFGGPDAAHQDFTPLQKAINYSMTSFLTTGGIRGKKQGVGKFQPRSFNMGISKEAFEATQGFSDMRAGEDIDLTFRLWKAGLKTQLIEEAYVYHKRRNTIRSFYKQTYAFGTARPLLNKRYPKTAKLTYWFPSLFLIGIDTSILLAIFGIYHLALLFISYFLLLFLDSLIQNKNAYVALLSIVTSITQFAGYGLGFLESKFFKRNNA